MIYEVPLPVDKAARWDLCRIVLCLQRVIRVISSVRRQLPVDPEEQTFSVSLGMSQKCRKRTSAGGVEMLFQGDSRDGGVTVVIDRTDFLWY